MVVTSILNVLLLYFIVALVSGSEYCMAPVASVIELRIAPVILPLDVAFNVVSKVLFHSADADSKIRNIDVFSDAFL